MYKKILSFLFYIILICQNAAGKDLPYKFIPFDTGSNVPDDIPIYDKNNSKHFMEEFEGNAVLMVFWASWCSQCSNEMQSLDILQKDFRKLDFKILPISVDYSGIETVKAFFSKYELRHLEMLHDYKNLMFKSMHITALPTSILLDMDGKLIGKFVGDVPWQDEQVRSILLDYIPNNPAKPKNSYKAISLDQKVKKGLGAKKPTPIMEDKQKENKNHDKEAN